MQIEEPKERMLFLAKQVNQDSIQELTKAILEINTSDRKMRKIYKLNGLKYKPKPIKLYIDSYGGAVYQCLGLIGVMEKSKTPIHTIVTGAAMSCGFIILIYGHKRLAYKHATIMEHDIANLLWGKVEELKDNMKEAKRLQRKCRALVVARTKIPKLKLETKAKTKKDWYFTAKQALKYKIIDRII